MSLFRHPHMTRGVVKTPLGAFEVSRGIVEAPEAVGEALGWTLLDEDDEESMEWYAARNRSRLAQRSAAY